MSEKEKGTAECVFGKIGKMIDLGLELAEDLEVIKDAKDAFGKVFGPFGPKDDQSQATAENEDQTVRVTVQDKNQQVAEQTPSIVGCVVKVDMMEHGCKLVVLDQTERAMTLYCSIFPSTSRCLN